jgi:hypothetical protein
MCLKKLVSIAPRIKSLTIDGCYSNFVQNTVVPVHFMNGGGPMLFSHISALQRPKRREEYIKHQFQLHDQFSDYLNQLLGINQHHLAQLVVRNCTLDLEMTELFCMIAGHAHSLETFIYSNNHDKGIHSSGLLQAIVIACPKMRHFRGLHSGMDDAVLLTMARHWKSLESLTLCSLKSRDVLGRAEIMSAGRHLTGSSPTGRISSHALWQLLCKCHDLRTLELNDLACITNHDLEMFAALQQQSEPIKKRFSPYPIPKSKSPGSSIRQLIITKYMTTPLSKPGFESLLKLFPKLNRLEYETNYYTFDNLFEGMSKATFNAECEAIQAWCYQRKLEYIGRWNAKATAEQRLMAGMASVSSDNEVSV